MSESTITIAEFTYSFDENRRQLKDAKGNIVSADVKKISDGEFSVLVGGRSFHLFVTRTKETATATVNNFIFEVRRETERDKLTKRLQVDSGQTASTITTRAPMPGLITKLLKQEGTPVAPGEGILVVEAMKMENEIKAVRAGTIKKIFVKERQTVEKNDNLFTIE
ncbi:MAG: biotin/lipoyl-containing protein [Bacteroidota bacterium]|jgi:biotin carboxyl carrier protein